MLIACWSAKGGAGTTVIAAALGTILAAHGHDTLLADLDGDLPSVVGTPEPSDGITTWARHDGRTSPAPLDQHEVDLTDRLRLLPQGAGNLPEGGGQHLATALAQQTRPTIVDCGNLAQRPPNPLARAVVGQATTSILVVRPCYLTLRHARQVDASPTGIVVVTQTGRWLRPVDVETALGSPVIAQVHDSDAVARAVDAGMLTMRPPRSFTTHLERAIRPLMP